MWLEGEVNAEVLVWGGGWEEVKIFGGGVCDLLDDFCVVRDCGEGTERVVDLVGHGFAKDG